MRSSRVAPHGRTPDLLSPPEYLVTARLQGRQQELSQAGAAAEFYLAQEVPGLTHGIPAVYG
jgi:hypothetical protein